LLHTRPAELIEDSPDNFWGIGKDGNGENNLGKLLMAVRQELGKDQLRPLKKSKFFLFVFFFILFSLLVNCKHEPVKEKQIRSVKPSYPQFKWSIEKRRQQFYQNYVQSNDRLEKDKIIEQSTQYLFKVFVDSLLPYWYGTRWDFNGITREPGKGSIACGSFVIFTLQDAGFKMPTKLYQLASERIIKYLCQPEDIKRFTNHASMKKVEKWLRQKGTGVYIVGLDYHVGFIINKEGHLSFCHSNYFDPPLMVVNQNFCS